MQNPHEKFIGRSRTIVLIVAIIALIIGLVRIATIVTLWSGVSLVISTIVLWYFFMVLHRILEAIGEVQLRLHKNSSDVADGANNDKKS